MKKALHFGWAVQHTREKMSTFLQHMKCSLPLDSIEYKLNCLCPRRSTDNEKDYTLKQPNAGAGNTLSLSESVFV